MNCTLNLPISANDALQGIVRPAMTILPLSMRSDDAARLMVAIALQESGLVTRQQVGGPAHGLWQFEMGGCNAVLGNEVTANYASDVCAARGVDPVSSSVYHNLLTDDILAACFARLTLWAVPTSIPDDRSDAWDYYVKAWRPGKPRIQDWADNWSRACSVVPVS